MPIMRLLLVPALASALLAACGPDRKETAAGEPSQEAASGRAEWKEADLQSAESMQRLVEERRARENMPGKPIYQLHCASCHEGGIAKAPHQQMIAMMTPEAILAAISGGVMKAEAAALNDNERTLVAEYLAGRKLGAAATPPPACAGAAALFDANRPPKATAWGIEVTNNRLIPQTDAGLSAADLPRLKVKWAFDYRGANRARSQPTLAGGAVHVGSHAGRVYALDEKTGCVRWSFQAAAEVRTGIVITPWKKGDTNARPLAYFGDILGNVYAISARDGALVWRDRPDDHPNATITGTPTLYAGRLLVPVSSLETGPPTDPAYECCKFRGSVVAYDATSGKVQWQTFTIAEAPTVRGKNRSGTDMYGPSGATVWNSPSIDAKRQQIYFGTGENLSSPATLTSDAIFALDLNTGAVKWTFQGTPNDAWNGACDTVHDDNCPVEKGPDFDFGAATLLLTTKSGKDLVIGGQKSGMVHALNPDTGKIVWQNKVGRGGIQGGIHFGMAADGGVLYVPITDMPDGRSYNEPARPGLYALDGDTGKILWSWAAPDDVCKGRAFCHPGISAAITATPAFVLTGSMDGVLRAHDAATGKVLWSYDTTKPVTTVSGATASGGSMGGSSGPILADGMLFANSGYGLYFHMPGNVLFAFAPEGP